MDKKNTKMNAKKALVSFLLIASVLFLATFVSAYDVTDNGNVLSEVTVKIDGVTIVDGANPGDTDVQANDLSVVAGDTISVKVVFTIDDDQFTGFHEDSASNVRIRAELEGETDDVADVTDLFDVEEGKTYVKRLTLKVPTEFEDDELSQEMTLNLKIWNSDYKTEVEDILINVQRPSYDLAIKSINVDNTFDAGEKVPVEFVLKNVGYNEADDVEVTVSIPQLGVEKTAYLGDIVTEPYEDSWFADDDEESTVSGKLTLEVPYSAEAGVYTLVIEASNDETTSTRTKEITVEKSEVAIKSGNDLILLNPTNKIVVYKVVYNANEQTVVIPAGETKTVSIETPTGEYSLDVAVYSGDSIVGIVNYSGSSQEEIVELTNPVFMLTVILAVVFLVLLVVLIVLITKKPQKTEEFGESYY